MAEDDCIFCKIIAGDLPGEIVDSDERTVAFLDINPATPGHALVVPRTHSTDLLDIELDDLGATMSAAQRLPRRIPLQLPYVPRGAEEDEIAAVAEKLRG